jgi:hypothetical protein
VVVIAPIVSAAPARGNTAVTTSDIPVACRDLLKYENQFPKEPNAENCSIQWDTPSVTSALNRAHILGEAPRSWGLPPASSASSDIVGWTHHLCYGHLAQQRAQGGFTSGQREAYPAERVQH